MQKKETKETAKKMTMRMDALAEAFNVGAGNAATALSQVIKKKVYITVPNVSVKEIGESTSAMGGSEAFVTAVYQRVLGDISGVMLIAMDKHSAIMIADEIMGQRTGSTRVLGEMALSALKEVSTIICGAYLNAVTKFLKMRITMTSPALAQDMAGALLEDVIAETCADADKAIIVNTELSVVSEKITAYFFFIPETASLEKMFKAMAV